MKQEALAIRTSTFGAARRTEYATTALSVLLACSICFGVFILFAGLNNGIFDLYNFRQTQSALTAYWLNREPHLFAYITPVLGSPWSVPFEYPIYQWAVVLLTKAGLPLVPAGRIVAFMAFIACIMPLRMLARDFSISNRAFLVAAAVFLASPFYVYWARSFMIETTALLFSLCWLAGFVRIRTTPILLLWIATFGFGTLAILTKSATFLSIAPIAGVIFIVDVVTWIGRTSAATTIRQLFWRGLLCLLPILIGTAWVVASDHFKESNPFSYYLSSQALQSWIFGTFAQRFLIKDTILTSLKETFGYIGPYLPILISLDLVHSKYRTAIIGSVAAYLFAFLIFTNLHIVHTYYQSSNAVFICLAVGLTVASILEKGCYKTAAVALVCIIVSQVHYFREYYWDYVTVDNMTLPRAVTALAARGATKPDESLLVIGDDWNSAIPFYSERKSLTIPGFTSPPLLDRILNDPQAFLGNARMGAVDCRLPAPWLIYSAEQSAKIDAFLVNYRTTFQSGPCRVLTP